jgi:hypothetical protein
LETSSTIRSPKDATVIVIENSNSSSSLEVVIPSIGLDDSFACHCNALGFEGDTAYWGLNYVVLGEWAHWSGGTTGAITNTLSGYETPVSALPTNGNAQFSGWTSGVVFKGSSQGAYVYGKADISVDFLSGKIIGALTNMQADRTPWNDVSVSGSIAGGTNTFTGIAAVTNAPNTPLSLTGSATGRMDGKFYGPDAENIGALWTLTDGTGSALGGFLARR